ncbi:MAG: LysM domain-containing protein, partial [Planctomycetia bacterium]|nr:LysM domain-containing protein [Planctomycetia bacterium]
GGPAAAAAFASDWAEAHDKLAAGRYAEALAVLSVWYDDTSLGPEESQRLEHLLGQLAGTVVYSQQDLLLPPHVVAAGETLQSIAAPLGVPWHLLAKINGVDDPARLVPGEQLKVLRGPFDAVVSVSRGRLSLQVGGNYAGSFPVVVGRQVQDRVGSSLAVVDVRRGGAAAGPAAQVAYLAGTAKSVALGDGLSIRGGRRPRRTRRHPRPRLPRPRAQVGQASACHARASACHARASACHARASACHGHLSEVSRLASRCFTAAAAGRPIRGLPAGAAPTVAGPGRTGLCRDRSVCIPPGDPCEGLKR